MNATLILLLGSVLCSVMLTYCDALTDAEVLQKCYDYGLRDAMELCPFDQYIPDNCRKDGYLQVPDFNGDGSVSSILMCPACDESTCEKRHMSGGRYYQFGDVDRISPRGC